MLSLILAALVAATPPPPIPTPTIYSTSVTDMGKMTVKVNRTNPAPGALLPVGIDHILVSVYDRPDTNCGECLVADVEGLSGHASVVRLLDPCDPDEAPQPGPLWIGVQYVTKDNIRGPSSPLTQVTWWASWQCVVSGW